MTPPLSVIYYIGHHPPHRAVADPLRQLWGDSLVLSGSKKNPDKTLSCSTQRSHADQSSSVESSSRILSLGDAAMFLLPPLALPLPLDSSVFPDLPRRLEKRPGAFLEN
eukprot:gene86-biopygen8861